VSWEGGWGGGVLGSERGWAARGRGGDAAVGVDLEGAGCWGVRGAQGRGGAAVEV
jgi:hypothetical protein